MGRSNTNANLIAGTEYSLSLKWPIKVRQKIARFRPDPILDFNILLTA
jgi:hypothetical protein